VLLGRVPAAGVQPGTSAAEACKYTSQMRAAGDRQGCWKKRREK